MLRTAPNDFGADQEASTSRAIFGGGCALLIKLASVARVGRPRPSA
jgi:hypothetical protein